MSKCKLWSPSEISLSIKIPQGYTLVIVGLCILGVPMGFQDFATHFLDEVLFQNMAHIDDFLLLGNTQVTLGILSSCVICQPSYFTGQYILLLFCFFWCVLTRKLCKYVGTLWV